MVEKNLKEFSFEEAYSHLEAILEELNSGTLSLEKSLQSYEQADKLMALCNQKLIHAEQRIETLMKNRQGEIETDQENRPKLQPFHLDTSP